MPQATITWSGYTVGTIENGTINYVPASSTAEYVSYDVATITFNSDNIESSVVFVSLLKACTAL